MMMRFNKRRDYKICSDCGAALDPGEICDCQKRENRQQNTNKKEIPYVEVGFCLGGKEGSFVL